MAIILLMESLQYSNNDLQNYKASADGSFQRTSPHLEAIVTHFLIVQTHASGKCVDASASKSKTKPSMETGYDNVVRQSLKTSSNRNKPYFFA